jgi:hypothetical protein
MERLQRRSLRTLLVATVATATVFGLPASAQSATTRPVNQGPVRADYLGPNTPQQQAASGADQCGTALSHRQGAWACPVSTTTTATKLSGSALATASAVTGWCHANAGCWQRTSDFEAQETSSLAVWGWNTTQLGEERHFIHIYLRGSQSWTNDIEYFNTHAASSVIVSGQLLNAAPGAVGQAVSGTFSTFSAGAVPAYTWRNVFTPNGYKSYNNTMWDHSQAHEFTWKVSGYPGYWWTSVKSISSHTTTRNVTGAIYRFRCCTEAAEMPAAWFQAGWHS